ncbi:hypothetical protein [Laceyella putida]|uniref:Uncharacterized protein n=1 Tax=Laceyella putida TaxID=110101 RepID=A0ABW2RRX4_9BACL
MSALTDPMIVHMLNQLKQLGESSGVDEKDLKKLRDLILEASKLLNQDKEREMIQAYNAFCQMVKNIIERNEMII